MEILDLRSIGYFRVGYQKMVNMAGSSKTFRIYHYQQVKCKAKTELDQYMRIIGKYGAKKKKIGPDKKHDPYPWLAEDDPRRY